MAAPSSGSGNLVEEFEESFQVSLIGKITYICCIKKQKLHFNFITSPKNTVLTTVKIPNRYQHAESNHYRGRCCCVVKAS